MAFGWITAILKSVGDLAGVGPGETLIYDGNNFNPGPAGGGETGLIDSELTIS